MSIKDWPTEQRPRERLIEHGPESLSDAELLAIFLRSGLPGLDVVQLSLNLIEKFGGLRNLLRADIDVFMKQKGLGSARYVQLQAILEMARRILSEEMVRENVMNSATATTEYLRVTMRDLKQEVFSCLWLDSQHRLIQYVAHFHGTIDAAAVYPRELVRAALQHNAAAVILAHNHPSGVAEPSQSDRQITRQIVQALALIDVRVLDHVIVGEGEVVSFAQRGLMD